MKHNIETHCEVPQLDTMKKEIFFYMKASYEIKLSSMKLYHIKIKKSFKEREKKKDLVFVTSLEFK